MAAVHRPHIASGYVAHVAYRPAPPLDGVLDWIIHYVPGLRARAEFERFNGKRFQPEWAVPKRPVPRGCEGIRRTFAAPSSGERQTGAPATVRSLAIGFLEKRYGVPVIKVAAGHLRQAQAVLDACGGDHAMAVTAVDLAAKEGRQSRAGFPKHLGGVLEGGFIERVRAARAKENRRRDADEQRVREQARRDRYEVWCRRRAEKRIRALSSEARRRVIDERLPAFTEGFRFFFQLRSWSDERIRIWAEPRILTRYGREGEPTLDAWSKLRDVPPTRSSGPDEALQ